MFASAMVIHLRSFPNLFLVLSIRHRTANYYWKGQGRVRPNPKHKGGIDCQPLAGPKHISLVAEDGPFPAKQQASLPGKGSTCALARFFFLPENTFACVGHVCFVCCVICWFVCLSVSLAAWSVTGHLPLCAAAVFGRAAPGPCAHARGGLFRGSERMCS